MKYFLALCLLSAGPVMGYTLVPDPSSPTGYSYGTGPSTYQIQRYRVGPGYRQEILYENNAPKTTCTTYGVGVYGTTYCQ
jgi:hypothetical protein